MRVIALAAAGLLLASASIVSATQLNSVSPEATSPAVRAQMQQKQNTQPEQKNQADQKAKQNAKQNTAPAMQQPKQETMTQKVKRTWRNWTSPSHTFCVRTPIPVPLTSKTCTAKGKTVEEARAVCVQQNPLSYVTAGKC